MDLQAVANATSEWLAEKSNYGLGGVFSESILTFPVAEFLIRGKRCAAKAEQDATLFEGAVRGNEEYVCGSGNVNYDLVSWPDSTQSLRDTVRKTIWEMKYLKTTNDSRIVKDFAKLALPKHPNVERLFLVANGTMSSTSQLLKQIGLKAFCVISKGKEIFEDNVNKSEVQFKLNETIIQLDADTKKAIRKYLSPEYGLRFDVKQMAKAQSLTGDNTTSYDVRIYSLTPID